MYPQSQMEDDTLLKSKIFVSVISEAVISVIRYNIITKYHNKVVSNTKLIIQL